MCPQSQVCLAFPVDVLSGPPSLRGTSPRSRRPLGQLGPQDWRRLRADVAPFFPPPHGAVADVPQTQAWARPPAGLAAVRAREAGHPEALSREARHLRPHVFARCLRNRVPCPGPGTPHAPAPGRSLRIARADQRPLLLGALRGSALHEPPRGPGGRDTAPHPRTAPGLCWALLGRACGSHAPQSSWPPRPVPVGHPPGQAPPATPGRRRPLTPLLGQRLVGPPRGLLTAIAHQMACPVLGRRHGRQGVRGPPRHQPLATPIARLQPAAAPPPRERCRGPTRQCFPGLLPREAGWHAHQPTQDETVATVPEARHPAQEPRAKQGQSRDGDHRRPRRAQGGRDHTPGMPAVLCYPMLLSTLICKAS